MREVLAARGLQQRDLAALSGLRRDRLSKYLSGGQAPPVYTLTRIATALGVPPDLLLPEIPLPLPSDRELYRLMRQIWLYPAEVRAVFATVLRGFCGLCQPERTEAALEAGGRHASRR